MNWLICLYFIPTVSCTLTPETLIAIGRSINVNSFVVFGGTFLGNQMRIARTLVRLGLKATYVSNVSVINLSSTSDSRSLLIADSIATVRDNCREVGLSRHVWIVMENYSENLVSLPLGTIVLFAFEENNHLIVISAQYRQEFNPPITMKLKTSLSTPVLSPRILESVSDKSRLLMGARLNLVTTTLSICDSSKVDNPFETARCSHLHMVDIFADMNALNVTFTEIRDRYAFAFPNGSSGPLFQQLTQRTSDMSPSSFVFTADRVRDFDINGPTFELKSVMFIKEPTESGISWSSYAEPFNNLVWLALGICMIIAALIFHYSTRHYKSATFILDAVYCAIQVFCNQGFGILSARSSFKLTYASLLLTALILLPAYSGSLVSYLTVRRPQSPFTSWEGFLKDRTYKIVTMDTSFIDYYLRSHLLRDQLEYLVASEKTSSDEYSGLNAICKDRFTYIGSLDAYRPGSVRYDCPILVLPITVVVQYLGMATPKNSPISEHLASGIMKMRALGLLDRMSKSLKMVSSDPGSEPKLSPMAVIEVSLSFIVLMSGIFIAAVIFITEKMISHNRCSEKKSIMFA